MPEERRSTDEEILDRITNLSIMFTDHVATSDAWREARANEFRNQNEAINRILDFTHGPMVSDIDGNENREGGINAQFVNGGIRVKRTILSSGERVAWIAAVATVLGGYLTTLA